MVEHVGQCLEFHLFEEIYNPGWYWLTIHDKRATKDQAIKSLKEHIKLPNGKVTVFGDGVNDIKMFKAADYAVAMENACLDCKNIANEIIGANTEDSVVNYLKKTWQINQ